VGECDGVILAGQVSDSQNLRHRLHSFCGLFFDKKNRPLQGGIKQTYVELLFFASELFDQLIQCGLDVAALAKQG
jgi:hypothetical protein